MAQVSYPGVYIQEIASGVRTITSVGTSTTAFVDFFREGPMNRAVEISGMSDFAREFGGLDARSEASYAIAQFFLNGGSTALVVRAHAGVAPGLGAATVGLRQTVAPADPSVVGFSAANEGSWGNSLRVEIDHRTADPSKFFNLTAIRYASPAKTAAPLTQEKFLNVTLDAASSRNVVKVLAADSKLLRAVVPAPTTVVPAANGTSSGPLTLNQAAIDALGSPTARRLRVQTFDEQLRKLYFDTCNYSQEAIELLCKVAGTDNVLFGTEKPGTGSSRDPVSGRDYDDMKPVIEGIEWLTDKQRRDIFECNCKRVYSRAFRTDDAR